MFLRAWNPLLKVAVPCEKFDRGLGLRARAPALLLEPGGWPEAGLRPKYLSGGLQSWGVERARCNPKGPTLRAEISCTGKEYTTRRKRYPQQSAHMFSPIAIIVGLTEKL